MTTYELAHKLLSLEDRPVTVGLSDGNNEVSDVKPAVLQSFIGWKNNDRTMRYEPHNVILFA